MLQDSTFPVSYTLHIGDGIDVLECFTEDNKAERCTRLHEKAIWPLDKRDNVEQSVLYMLPPRARRR